MKKLQLSRGYPIELLLQRDHNNLDLIRLFAACLVIFGHQFVITPDPAIPMTRWDPFTIFGYPGVYSASVGVKIFFFISGLLVTHSLLRSRDLGTFFVARFMRIWPALITLVALTAFALGPLVTVETPRNYFNNLSPYLYALNNLLLTGYDHLPGVFTESPFPRMVNGSLWTLPWEVGAYAWLVIAYVAGAFRFRAVATVLLLIVIADPLRPHPLLFPSKANLPQELYLPSCFALGTLCHLFRTSITMRWEWVGAATVAFALGHTTPLGPHLLFILLFIAVLYIAASGWFRRLRLSMDLSYGTYLWGFPMQQLVASMLPETGFWFKLVLSIALTLICAYASWHLVEKPALDWVRRYRTAHSTATQARPPPPPIRI